LPAAYDDVIFLLVPLCCAFQALPHMPAAMATQEHQADDYTTCTDSWLQEFFSEERIVRTMQHLLQGSTYTVDDLCRLCVAASQDHVVLAFNLQGLMPFANHPEFVFPFASMSLSQIQTLRRQCRAMPDAMVCEYDVDVYVLKLTQEQVAVDHTLLLFAAACILLRGLSQTRALDRGIMCAYLTEKPDLLAHHANAILFQIVHACSLRMGALQEAMKLLQKHNVRI
jgi:hypothetical protein